MSAPRSTPERVLAAIAERRLALELGTLDICFLVALHVRGEGAGLTAFTEAQLEDVFAQASAVAQPEADQLRRRATHAASSCVPIPLGNRYLETKTGVTRSDNTNNTTGMERSENATRRSASSCVGEDDRFALSSFLPAKNEITATGSRIAARAP